MVSVKTYNFVLYLIISLFNFGCTDSGIIEGGTFTGKDNNFVKAFYLYDYVREAKVKRHALSIADNFGYPTAFFYFSHNTSVPTQNLKISKSFLDASNLMIQYSHGLKYVFYKSKSGQFEFFDCLLHPESQFCNGTRF